MRKETLYLDTSVISAYYDDRMKERQEITIKFWEETLPNYQVYISEITLEELENTKDKTLRKKLKSLIEHLDLLKVNAEIENLASIYIDYKIFPERYFDDALHVAISSFNGITFVASWNFEHLVKVKTRRLVKLVNAAEGFREIEIVSPQEL